MFTAAPSFHDQRLRAGLPTLAVHALLALALFSGLNGRLAPEAPAPPAMSLIDLIQPPPPQARPIPSPRERQRRREGAASPPNLEARRTTLVAADPVIPRPQEVVAAPRPGTGSMADAGSARIPGPGTGSGGFGTGTGSGRYGDGPGGGGDGDGDGGSVVPPRQIGGRISDRDYPPGIGEAGVRGRVVTLYTIQADGRVTNCRIEESSGSDILDETTCRLIVQRFRFDPARDRRGRPVRSRMVQDHYWEVEDEPRTYEVRRRRRPF